MKRILLLILMVAYNISSYAQPPVISGETMLCANSNGTTAVEGTQVYDTYTWYTKYWFTSDPFEPVSGVSGPTFTYDWYTYDQSLIKVVVTLNGETFESNTIQIDSYAWIDMVVSHEMGDNVTFDPDSESFSLCEGTSFLNEIFNPYTTNIQWFKDGAPIVGANSMSYPITTAGTYTVTAAPPFCPDNMSTSLPIVVTMNPDCQLGIIAKSPRKIRLYPNPANDRLHLDAGTSTITKADIYSVSGQLIKTSTGSEIDVSHLASGFYILSATVDDIPIMTKFIKR